DFYRFSGIFRSVYLYMLPRTAITDLSVIPTLNEDFSRGEQELEKLFEAGIPAEMSLFDSLSEALSRAKEGAFSRVVFISGGDIQNYEFGGGKNE
ncbi:MAG: hypothetical protein IIY69_01630, partial [Clostridia bacterium]|nr:hypothetical protein [Clostridia bacterium]